MLCYNEFTEMSQKCHKMNEKENEKDMRNNKGLVQVGTAQVKHNGSQKKQKEFWMKSLN